MVSENLTHSYLVGKLERFRSFFEKENKHIGASEFLITLLNKLTFMKDSEDVFYTYEIRSEKYNELKKLNSEIAKAPRAKELIYLIKYADAIRNVQMSQTYIGQVKYLTAKIFDIPKDELNTLFRHVRNVTLLTGDFDLLQNIYCFDKGYLARFSFPDTIKSEFPEHLAKLIPSKRTAETIAYDRQNDFEYLKNIPKEDMELLNEQQRTGLLVNKARFLNDRTSYLNTINSLFSSYNLSPLLDINLSQSNVLSSLRFDNSHLKKSSHDDFVTVIMSCFNAEETVEYAINSMLCQTHKNFELLVCDDESSDNTLKILIDISKKDPRVRVFKSNYNQGTYNIRNSLLSKAKGEYITFQDSDDVAHPERLDEQLTHLKSKKLLVTSCRWIRITPQGDFVFFSDGLILRFCVVSTMVHRTVFNIVPKFRSSLVAADTEFHENCLLLLGNGRVGVLDKPMILGLWGENSLTKMENLKAEHNGFVAPRRRAFSEIAARQRVLGSRLVGDKNVNDVLKEQGIYREYAGAQEI